MNKLKVILTGLFVACLSIGMVSAQANTTAAKPAAKKSAAKAKSGPVAPTTGSRKDVGTSKEKPAQHLKKDGTPDMRYKENKTAKPAAAGATAKPAAAAKDASGTKK